MNPEPRRESNARPKRGKIGGRWSTEMVDRSNPRAHFGSYSKAPAAVIRLHPDPNGVKTQPYLVESVRLYV